MTREINALYNGDMTKLLKKSYDFRLINQEAKELAESEGLAVVIRVRDNLLNLGSSLFHLIRYSSQDTPYQPKIRERIESFSVPKSLIKLIIDEYKNY